MVASVLQVVAEFNLDVFAAHKTLGLVIEVPGISPELVVFLFAVVADQLSISVVVGV